MQNISRGGYSREEILDVLHSRNGARNVRFRYDLHDKDGAYKRTLQTVQSGEVAMSAFSTIKRTAKFRIMERTLPETRGYEQEEIDADWSTAEDWNKGVNEGIFLVGDSMRIYNPAGTALKDWNFETATATNGLSDEWYNWGVAGQFQQSSTGGFNGYGQRLIRTQEGGFGIATKGTKEFHVNAGTDTLYLSFLFKPETADFAEPSYCYLLYDGSTPNARFSDYTITDIGDGWFRYDGQMVAPSTGYLGLLVGWRVGTGGSAWVDNIYFQKNYKPVFKAEWISDPITISTDEYGAILESTVSWNATLSMKSKATVYSRYSTDGGSNWSDWYKETNGATIHGVGAGTVIEGGEFQVQFRVILERFQIVSPVAQFDSLTVNVKREYEVMIPERTEVNYLTDRIKPYMEVQMPDGNWIDFPLGVFLLSTPTRHDDVNEVYRDIEAYDGLIILDDDKFTSRYTIKAGTKYTKAVEDILLSAGITEFNIADKADTLKVDKEFKIGTSKLEAVNDLLSSINYTPIWVDANGYFTAYQYVSPADKRADFTYADDEVSVIYNGMEEELDLTETANSWVVTESNPEKEPLVSSKVNDSPDSPTSTVNMGRTIVDFREVDDIADQATLNAYVDRIAFEASQVFGKLKFKTALMPFHEYSDVLHIKYDPLRIDYKFSETNWSMKLEAGGEMEHEVRRVVDI